MLKKWDRVEIKWLDSTHTVGWMPYEEEGIDDEQMYHQSVGYFLEENAKAIMIVQSYNTHYKNSIDAIMVIPKCSILKKVKI